ncbi:MAG: hypothetical protein KatS3mg090_0229 [Patescibacteria group bacterium]|nr:MAG: hypothetical protein KatS3mg090_0229 [Patescibacteria group bacterium]
MKRYFITDIINKVDQEVELYGWVNSIRDHKKVVFIDLRDRSGLVQLVGDESLSKLSVEDVVYIKGKVKKRPQHLVNPNLETGEIEVEVVSFEKLSSADVLPFNISDLGYDLDEQIRLKYRYLDLRRDRMKRNLFYRQRVLSEVRKFLASRQFWEVDTPILTKSTPEGARDFIVPSRLKKGKFYALPQSPQQYKQLLMVAGVERYFQIARCFRDEDPRADRAYGEFTQIDIEMSFVTQEDIRRLVEQMIIEIIEKVFPEKKILQVPFPIIDYQTAIKKYNTDRPDIRESKDENVLAFCWVVDFPAFEWSDEEKRWTAVHHPFTSPKKEDLKYLEQGEYDKVRADQYDLALNGFEVAGGSIRITDPNLQSKIFQIMGHSEADVKKKFGHLLKAFSYGVPPHGGIAIGFDRLLQVILNERSVREVIAFPATSGGVTAVMSAPDKVSDEQLKELGIAVIEE